jgi:GST-like protein
MYTLYGSRGSGSAAIEAALELAHLPYRSVRASSWEADSAQHELRRLNPLGQIPTLLAPGGGVLTESAAILIHLGLQHPGSGLLPQDAAARAQAIRGLVFIAANCYGAISIIDYPERWHADPDEATGARVRQASRARLHEHWCVFADQFASLMATDAPAAMDVLASVVSRWSGARAHLRHQRPAFLAQLEATDKHASVAAVFARHWPA